MIWTVIHNSRFVRIHFRRSELFNDGTCAGGRFWIHSRNLPSVTTVNHFVEDCPNLNLISTLGLLLRCTRTFECGGCPSMQQSGLSSPFVFVCLLYDLLSFLFHCRLCIWNQYCLKWKVFLFVLLGFPRHACLRDRSPESSEPHVTLDSSKFAEQNNIRSSYFFLPRFSLESISYSPDF